MTSFEYVFKYGPSPDYRFKEARYPTLQEARDAAYKERLMGWTTSRIRKVEKEAR